MSKHPSILILDDLDLSALVTAIKAADASGGIHRLRIDPRGDGFAVKINEGMWSPTIGRAADSGGY